MTDHHHIHPEWLATLHQMVDKIAEQMPGVALSLFAWDPHEQGAHPNYVSNKPLNTTVPVIKSWTERQERKVP